jgi:uncharacterized protein
MAAEHSNIRTLRRCPICRKLFDPANEAAKSVFCSPRCQRVDLGRWLNGAYAIPDDENDPESDVPYLPEHKDQPR